MIPLSFNNNIKNLPNEGVDWSIEKSLSDYNKDKKPNTIVALLAVVDKKYQAKGLSYLALQEMVNLAKKKGIKQLIVPVRPTSKHQYPLISMEDYIKWKNDDNLPFDSWLRVHVKFGGEIIKVCSKSMHIQGSIAEWEDWTGLNFPSSGKYIIPKALNPIYIDIKKNEGLYVEPNVWVLHKIK